MSKIKAYSKAKKGTRSQLTRIETVEGERIEQKVARLLDNNEPITDGASEIFTERRDGVVEAYNIRTDRFEVACDAMDTVSKSKLAKREGKGKVVKLKADEKEDNIGDKSIQGKTE